MTINLNIVCRGIYSLIALAENICEGKINRKSLFIATAVHGYNNNMS